MKINTFANFEHLAKDALSDKNNKAFYAERSRNTTNSLTWAALFIMLSGSAEDKALYNAAIAKDGALHGARFVKSKADAVRIALLDIETIPYGKGEVLTKAQVESFIETNTMPDIALSSVYAAINEVKKAGKTPEEKAQEKAIKRMKAIQKDALERAKVAYGDDSLTETTFKGLSKKDKFIEEATIAYDLAQQSSNADIVAQVKAMIAEHGIFEEVVDFLIESGKLGYVSDENGNPIEKAA